MGPGLRPSLWAAPTYRGDVRNVGTRAGVEGHDFAIRAPHVLDRVAAHVHVLRVARPEIVVGDVAAEAAERDPGAGVVLHDDLPRRIEVVQPAAEPDAVIADDPTGASNCGLPRGLFAPAASTRAFNVQCAPCIVSFVCARVAWLHI